MFDEDLVAAVRKAADAAGIPQAALLAVVEIESAGKVLEDDGQTPRLLFERHVFHRELKARAPSKLADAVAQGLALAKRSPTTQYKDQGSSANRLKLVARARAIDEECANLACSWGLGQTMGFCAEEIGFPTATAMVAWMTDGGVDAQIEAMVREIKRKSLVDELQREDWKGFARVYNGPAYAENKYDTKLDAAEERWESGAGPARGGPLAQKIPEFELRAVQQRLLDLGYTSVGMVDGRLGSKTIGAISAFQADNGLTVDGLYGPETKAKLADPETPRREIGLQRATATAADLRAAGSGTVKTADQISLGAKALVALGLGGAGQQAGLLDGAKQALDTASAVRPLVDSAAGLLGWAAANWSMLAVLAGGAGIYLGGQIVARRVEQFRADRNV